jgi:hypothetical protein
MVIMSLVTFTEKIHKMFFLNLNLRRTGLLSGDEHFRYFIKSSHPTQPRTSSCAMTKRKSL